jgi:hypothetical protein
MGVGGVSVWVGEMGVGGVSVWVGEMGVGGVSVWVGVIRGELRTCEPNLLAPPVERNLDELGKCTAS